MTTKNKNTNVSLSNEFVQQPQAPFSQVETKLFHAALLELHQKKTAFKPLYCVHIADIIDRQGNNYSLLTEAITSLKSRIWFNEPLFLEMTHVKREGVVEFAFNPALQGHLLNLDSYYTCIDVADLEKRGLKQPVAWRLLWLLRSWYRPLAKRKEKELTIAELESLLFAGENPYANFSQLKQHVGSAVKALAAAGVVVDMKSKKRGLVAKGLTFSIPALTLTKKTKAKKLVEAVVGQVADVIQAATEAIVAAPVIAAMAVAPAVVSATPVAPIEHVASVSVPASSTPTGNLGGYLNQVLRQATVNRASTPNIGSTHGSGLPANTAIVASLPSRAPTTPVPQHQDKYNQLYMVLERKWLLANWQISLLRSYVAGDNVKYDKVRDVIRILNCSDTSTIKNLGAVTWCAMKKAIPVLNKN